MNIQINPGSVLATGPRSHRVTTAVRLIVGLLVGQREQFEDVRDQEADD